MAHEAGHAVNNFYNPLKASMQVCPDCQDPANRNAFHTKKAMDWQEHYDLNKKNYPTPQLMFIMYGIKL
ncbi:MAG: hypothetical protein JNM71_16055 [Flavobacterium lindanitolerans]|uniref:hypothetical protein n=1 Tax=Flavobacterium lindanitolerans TaxID=428988 RepID=UPI001A60C9C6|nr:hypothetical protein [Flavobacterium lindanitolerans]MBL7869529.1 hypothetical protein [Flavobacterium lindanitolerans]